MNRPIKFRAWDIFYKKFVVSEDGAMDEFWKKVESGRFAGREVPVMQFTGLLDKNGKEIYEGDVAKTQFNGNSEVVFWQGCFCFMREDGNGHIFNPKDIEIIGNIYENSDLLV